MTAGDVAVRVSALMNDVAQDVYTFEVVLPYLNMALDELQEEFQLNNVPVTNETSAVIEVDAGTTVVPMQEAPPISPAYPADLIEIQRLWERQRDINPFVPMTRREFLPHNLEGSPVSSFVIWAWMRQEIRLPESLRDNDIKIDYIQALFAPLTADDDTINVINSMSFLAYRTAGLCSEFIGENPGRAEQLNNYAVLGLDRVEGIAAKGRQSIVTRRRPFRSGYRGRIYGA